ncbi:MAG: S1 RNA-binding domain-containing protein [Labilithrix sp.]|nr:S1 RNA-binding domain-containing protein [Labilithrix sp.]MCW5815608.1 S1 RNA-binding domain-containing protein [Labilithrix sp.]
MGDSFAALFEAQGAADMSRGRRKRVKVGDRLEAVVVQIGKDLVFVELDGKQQAFIEASELRNADGEIDVAVGEVIRAHVVEVNEASGGVRLGRSIGRPGNMQAIEQAKETGVAVEGKVTGVNKGGLEVDLGGGTRAFCPSSQASDRFVQNMNDLIGQSLRFVVTDFKEGGKNIVVSRRALLEREASETMAKAMSEIVPGAVLKGTVSSVRDFGAFIDLGGVEGMIPRSEISHDRSVAITEALKPGDVVEVSVVSVKDAEPDAKDGKKKGRGPQKKISLSLKALAADPWEGLDLAEGRVVLGTVTRTTDFGRFVRIAPGVEGLLHVSELGRDFKAEEGEEVRVVVKKMDRQAKKIGLVPAPDDAQVGATIQQTSADLKVNAVVTGTVERIETYGIFVQVEGTKGRAGRGLVPNVELGVPRGTDLRKAFPEGTKVTAKVLETGEGKLRLSIKGAQDAAERADFEAARGKVATPKSLGTFADLLKGKKLS